MATLKETGITIREAVFDVLTLAQNHATRSLYAAGAVTKSFVSGLVRAVEETAFTIVDLVVEIAAQVVVSFFSATRVALGSAVGFPTRIAAPVEEEDEDA